MLSGAGRAFGQADMVSSPSSAPSRGFGVASQFSLLRNGAQRTSFGKLASEAHRQCQAHRMPPAPK